MRGTAVPQSTQDCNPAIAPIYDQAWHFVNALTGDANTAVVDWRAIHDVNKSVPAMSLRGTLADCWSTLCAYNNLGYGIFAVIAEMNGQGNLLHNVTHLRAHYIDLDGLDAQMQYERACNAQPAPAFAVNSSYGPLKDGNGKPTSQLGNKWHCYWPVTPYIGNDRFTVVQRKLRQVFNSDKVIVDATRVMRVPGTLHRKGEPFLVALKPLAGWGQRSTVEQLEAALQSVNVIDGGVGARHELGEPSLQAPDIAWIERALFLIDPNSLDRGEWVSLMAAVKQSGWSHGETETRALWDAFCARYDGNDPGENEKQWNSIRNTEVGWPALAHRAPGIKAPLMFGGVDRTGSLPQGTSQAAVAPLPGTVAPAVPMPAPMPPPLDCSGEYLTHIEQQEWFRGCTIITAENRIIGPDGTIYESGAFNTKFGGKLFIIDGAGKKTDEAWKAATRSTLWRMPEVTGTCFRPDLEPGDIITDELGCTYLNTYVPATIKRKAGDVTPFFNHLAKILPDPHDQRILIEYMAHNAKYPGHKIYWAPVIQSVEGVGKNVFKRVMRHVIAKRYFYQPKAKQLNDSGSKFNGWMEGKLFFLVDEVKTDEKRDLVETLKPFITETELEIEGKGSNQKMGDTPGNWLFFTNHKDAILINRNGRRFAIFYSAIQTVDDLHAQGMNDAYFDWLYNWLDAGGLEAIADWLMEYPIERGKISNRAPETSSKEEALIESRGWLEVLIDEAVQEERNGFRNGWINTAAVGTLLRERRKDAHTRTVGEALKALGYHLIGRAGRSYMQDDPNKRGQLWNINPLAAVANYGPAQSYE